MDTIDINDYDKSHFECYKFPDGSIYFGEIGYLDPVTGTVLLEQSLYNQPEEKIKEMKKVRHGKGIQLFEVDDINCNWKYEGHWSKDKKHGLGKCYFRDNSIYEGSFVNDLFEGLGKFSWPDYDTYYGQWKSGRMEGEGEFKHHDGHIIKGMFKNNYFFDGERFCNPFLNTDERDLFIAKNKDYMLKRKSEEQKFSRKSIFKVSDRQELISKIEETIKSDKTPLILRSREYINLL
jgi:hypothetical protein